MKIEHLDARGILNETRQFASPVAEQEDVSINQDYNGANLPPVLADRKQLRQVLLNLITNGIKYNKPGGTVIPRHSPVRCIEAWHLERVSDANSGRGVGVVIADPLESLAAGP